VSEDASIEVAIRERHEAGAYDDAATLLLQSYGREILGFLVSRLRDPELAGDVFSRFCEDVWRGLRGFGWRCSARAWAYTLARNAASRELKVVQRERRRRVPLSQAAALSKLEQKIRTETLRLLKTETRSRIAALRERLPEDDQALLLLRINRKLDFREIAHVMLGDAEAADAVVVDREAARLRKRFQLVKQQLRKLAKEEGLLDDA
jgi:RNA polymerase sigma-70 factor (ECF subfamily)